MPAVPLSLKKSPTGDRHSVCGRLNTKLASVGEDFLLNIEMPVFAKKESASVWDSNQQNFLAFPKTSRIHSWTTAKVSNGLYGSRRC